MFKILHSKKWEIRLEKTFAIMEWVICAWERNLNMLFTTSIVYNFMAGICCLLHNNL